MKKLNAEISQLHEDLHYIFFGFGVGGGRGGKFVAGKVNKEGRNEPPASRVKVHFQCLRTSIQLLKLTPIYLRLPLPPQHLTSKLTRAFHNFVEFPHHCDKEI